MKTFYIILLVLVVQSSSNKYVYLYVHRPSKNDGDKKGDPKYGFFYDNNISYEISKYTLKLSNDEYSEIKKLMNLFNYKKDLDTLELYESLSDRAIIYGKDTLYGYGQSWTWKKRVVYFESSILKKALDKYKSKNTN